MNALIKVLKTDNELNGVVAMRLIIDIQKTSKASVPATLPPILEIFLQFYGNFEKVIEKYLGKKPRRANTNGVDENTDNVYPLTENDLIPCMESCKFMLELPIIILYFLRGNAFKDSNVQLYRLFEKMQDIFNYEISVADNIMTHPIGKERVEDFMLLRVKTISFLIYTSRYMDKNGDTYAKEIPRFVIKCLKECPDECITPRKEILQVIRHIVEPPVSNNNQVDHLNTICSHFMPYMNELLDDSVLIGKSRSAYETVRSSAYSTVLEVLKSNQTKVDFTPSQMYSCIIFCTKVLYDNSLGGNIHALSVALMVSLSQTIYLMVTRSIRSQNTENDGITVNNNDVLTSPHIIRLKELLLNIIRAFVQKVKYLSKFIKTLVKKKPVQQDAESSMILPFSVYKSNDNFNANISYCCSMFKQIIDGLKSTVIVFNVFPKDCKFSEQPLLTKLFRYGIDCFDVYNLVASDSLDPLQKQKMSEEEKDIFNNYSSLYTSISIPLFSDIFKTQFDYFYKKLLEGRPMTFIHIPANILSSNQPVASALSEILLKFLLKRMDRIGKDRKEAHYMHNLFKLVFGSIVTFPKNESVLRNQMSPIVTHCFTYASKFKDCLDYYLILRSLFNSILTAKFDLLCKEFAPLLPTVLEKLAELVNNAHDRETRNLFVELALTVPSKLHVSCPYLYLLIKPILYALQPGSSEKAVAAALRNLDSWVTSLRNESLEAILKPVIPDLLKALFTHLKPQHYSNGSNAMRLLAKLGGTHRQYMSELTTVNTKASPNALFFDLKFNSANDNSNLLPMDDIIDLSVEICFDKENDVQTKKQAFDNLKLCLLSMVSVNEKELILQDDFKLSPKFVNSKKFFHVSPSSPKPFSLFQQEDNPDLWKTSQRYEGEIQIFNKILKTIFLFMNYAVRENLVECIEFTKNLIRHFALISIFSHYNMEEPSKFRINNDWFYDTLVEVYEDDCNETSPNNNVGDFILGIFTDYVYEICEEDPDLVIQFGIWERLQTRFTQCLYQPEWYKKCVGAKGILFLCENISPVWLASCELDIIRGLFFSIKYPPSHMLPHTNQITIAAAESLIRSCHATPALDFSLLFNNKIYDKVERVDEAPSNLGENEVAVQAAQMGREPLLKKRNILYYLCTEMAAAQAQVRKLAQSLLRLAADCMNIPVISIVERFKPDSFLPKDDKTKQQDVTTLATSFDIITFYLCSKESNISSAQVQNAYQKALSLLKNEEQPKEPKEQKKVLSAKLIALKLLREVMVCKEIRYHDREASRDYLKSMLETVCKFLVANNKEVVFISKTALITFFTQFKVPKESLQTTLKQITNGVSKYTHLNSIFVNHIGFFLKVNSNINALVSKLSNQLMEHLKKWLDKQNIKHIQAQKEKPLVAADMLSLFSIAPDPPEHIATLVKTVLTLENVWAEEIKNSNPFIAPIAKFLNIYPEPSTKFLFDMNGETCFALQKKQQHIFTLEVVKSRKSPELRAYIFNNPSIFVKLLSAINTVEFVENQSFALDHNNALVLLGSILKLSPKWYSSQSGILEQLVRIWNIFIKHLSQDVAKQNVFSMDLTSDQEAKTQFISETQRLRFTKKMLKLMISYCNNTGEVNALFEIVKVFGCGLVMDLSFVTEFFENQVGNEYDLTRQEEILQSFLTLFKKEETFVMKSNILKHVAIPIMFGVSKRGATLSPKILTGLFEDILNALPAILQKFTEKEKFSIKADLLQLTTLFVKYSPSPQVDIFKKVILKFSYENCIVDDITTNQCAFVLIANLTSKIGLPPKVIHNVYMAFLKDCRKDSKSLVLPALDMIIQPVKLAVVANEPKTKFPHWIKVTKKTLLEDSPSTHQLINIWTIFIRHAEYFYESRECFIYKMINSLSKIGYSSMDNKKLYVQLVDLIISWEEQALRKYTSDDENEKKRKVDQTDFDDSGLKKRKVDETTALNQSVVNTSEDFILKPQSRGVILNFLVRMCIFVSQSRTEKPQILYKECIQILKRALNIWKDETVSFSQVEKHIPISEESAFTLGFIPLSCLVELTTFFVDLNRGIIQLNAQLAKRLLPLLTTPYADVHRNVCILFKTLFKHFDPLKSKDQNVQEFYSTIWQYVRDVIAKHSTKDLPLPGRDDTNAHLKNVICGSFGHLLLLHVLCDHYRSEDKQQYSKQVQSLLLKVTKNTPTQVSNDNDYAWKELYIPYIELCLSFLSDGVHETLVAKHYFQNLLTIIDRGTDFNIHILHLVVDIVLNWLKVHPSLEMTRCYSLQLTDSVKTMTVTRNYKITENHKTTFITKLGQLFDPPTESLSQLKREYYNVVAELYQNLEEVQDQNYAKKIEYYFMSGLKLESKELRDISTRFISILNDKVEKSVFKRLSFIIDHQKWEPLSDKFWIKYALELLLEAIDQGDKLKSQQKMAKLPYITSWNNNDHPSVPISKSFLDKLKNIFTEHESFIQLVENMKAADFVNPMKLLIKTNTNLSLKFWGELFALAWNALSNEEKSGLQQQMQKLISIDYHSKQYTKYPNVIQALLLGINNAVMAKKRDMSFNYLSIHPETLKFSGKSFNAWSLTLPLFEEELKGLLNAGTFDEKTEKICNSITELYRVLKEEDMLCGIFRSCDVTENTKLILSLEQRNNWSEAQEGLKELLHSFQKGSIKKKVTHTELQLWEDHWLICTKKLQQWDELTKYSQSSHGGNAYFNLECLFKNGQWAQMKESFQKNQSIENQYMKYYHISCLIMQDREVEAMESYQVSQQLALQRWCALPSFICGNHTSMLQSFQQLYELNESAILLSDTKKPITTHELKGFLTTWRDRLPSKYEEINTWNELFTWRSHFLKKVIERFDLKDKEQKDKDQNKEQKDDVFNHHKMLLLNETIWSLHKFAKIARKQNFIEPALKMLSDTGKILPTLGSETSELFVRIIEVIKSLIKDNRYNDALDFIESETIANTKLKTTQKMEILRLRGEVFSTCNRYDESYQTFSQSISYFPQDQKFTSSTSSTPAWGKSFFQWALVLDKLFVEKWNSPSRHLRQKQNSTKHPTQSMTALDFAENCVASYLLAIRYSGGATNHQTIQASGATVRQYIGRVLWLLSFDEPSTEKSKIPDFPIHRVAEKCIGDIPAWMWIPWYQQLFSMIQRRECEQTLSKTILKSILVQFPQSAFHTLRSFVHDLRDLQVAITKRVTKEVTPPTTSAEANAPVNLKSTSNIHVSIKGSNSTEQFPNANTARAPSNFFSEVFQNIRRRLDEVMQDGVKNTFSELEVIYKELTKQKSEVEQELVKSLELLLEKAYSYNIYQTEDHQMLDEDDHQIPTELIELAKRFNEVYFQDIPVTQQQQQQQQQLAPQKYISEIKCDLMTDILPRKERVELAATFKYLEKTTNLPGPKTLQELINNIKKRITIIQTKMNLLPTQIGIESQKLKMIEHKTGTENSVEIPGQYELVSDREPFAERHEKILCLLPSISMKGRKNKEAGRTVSIRSTSGKVFKFFIQSCSNFEQPTLKTEEKVCSLIRHVNRIFEKDKSTRSHNNIHLEYPITITASQKIRLVREDYDYISFEDILNDYYESIGKPIDAPLVRHWEEMNKACTEHINEFENKVNVYHNLIESPDRIPDDILSNYVRGICPSWSEYYSIRKTFAIQSGVYNIFSHLLHTKDRNPYKILFSKNSGHIFQFDFRPTMHKPTGIIQRDDPTPFRFTRNISHFLTQFGVEGYLLNTMSSVAFTLSENKDIFETLLQLFIRDELVSYHYFNPDILTPETTTPLGENRFHFQEDLLKSTTQQNVDVMLDIVKELAPPIPTNLTCSPPQVLPAKKKSKKDTTSETPESVSTPSSTPSTPMPSTSQSTATIATSLLDLPPLNSKVHELLQHASSPEKLCLKEPAYYPWF